MPHLHNTYLSLGSNLGNKLEHLTAAKNLLQIQCGNIVAQSSIYETAAWGLTHQPNFLNQVIQLKTTLTAQQLIKKILAVELQLGRKRTIKMGPRTIDIDILLMDNQIVNESNLVVPHPKMHQRKFVLLPLNEIAANQIHPIFNTTIAQLLAMCDDDLEVKKNI